MGDDDNGAKLMEGIILFGGAQAGFNTNLEKTEIEEPFIVIKGQKLVCVAQGGECRYNHRYYTMGMRDTKSWRTPIVDSDCPDKCGYKMLVCDEHGEKCEGSIEYYPYYNKFRGLFRKYCRNFDKFLGKEGEREKEKKEGKREIKEERKSKERIKEGTTIIMTKCTTKGFRPEYIDIVCLTILLLVFFMALFLTHGIWIIVDLLLLGLTGAILGRTIGKMVKV